MLTPRSRADKQLFSKKYVTQQNDEQNKSLGWHKKGAFILTSDGRRSQWGISGPHFAGWEIYHVKGSPVEPNRLYASQTSGWFGQLIQRSDDGGETWYPPGSNPTS